MAGHLKQRRTVGLRQNNSERRDIERRKVKQGKLLKILRLCPPKNEKFAIRTEKKGEERKKIQSRVNLNPKCLK